MSDNKEKFEIIARIVEILLIGGFGIYLSFQGNRIADLQYRLSYAELQPQFTVYSDFHDTDEDGIADTEYIFVNLDSGNFTNLQVDTKTLLTYSYYDREFEFHKVNLEIVDLPYKVVLDVALPENNVYFTKKPSERQDFGWLAIEVLQKISNSNIQLQRIVTVKYDDVLGDNHCLYYVSSGEKYSLVRKENIEEPTINQCFWRIPSFSELQGITHNN